MALRFTDQDNVRDAARGQSTSFSPTQDRGRNRTRIDNLRNNSQFNKPNKPSMFQQGSNAIGNFNPIPGIAGFAMEGAKAIGRDRAMQKQNDAYFGNTMLKNSPQYKKAQMSLMTPKDKDFYDKYMNLADMAQDNNKAEEYRDIAKTAYNNMQTTGRMNYGLSNIDPENDYLNSAGLPSYSKDLFGEGYGRMDMEAFKNAMGMGEGILDAIPAAERHPDVLDNYANQTFMPNISIEFGGNDEPISSDGYDGPIDGSNPRGQVTSANPAPGKMGLDPNIDYGNEMNMLDAIAEDNVRFNRDVKAFPPPIKEEPPFQGMAPPELIEETEPFNDNLREAGIMSQYGQGPSYANNSMNYLDEYKKALSSGEFGYDTPGGMMSYDEFVKNYERLHSLPRGLHLGE
tara:strand:- start:891 stop:2090 length:1200 start_codon:yes stop_codon:yes gene_type:complete